MKKRIILILIPVLFSGTLATAQLSLFSAGPGRSGDGFPELTSVRQNFHSAVSGSIQNALSQRLVDMQNTDTGRLARFVVRRDGDSFFLLFLNQQDDGSFSVAGAGNYIIQRLLSDGSFVQLKIFLKNDPGTFIRIFPLARGRSRMNVFLYGSQIYEGINIPLDFSNILHEPFSRIVEVTGALVNWDLLLNPSTDTANPGVRSLASAVRSYLPGLSYADDGALNSSGELVYIETGEAQQGQFGFNCSGFAKWVMDGLYTASTGLLMEIAPLTSPETGLRGTDLSDFYEDERDPYFGLDWTRNLAVTIMSEQNGVNYSPEAADVRDVRFFKYTEDIGFPIAQLRSLFYTLINTESNQFYIGSVNMSYGTEPVLRQHIHVALFFPYLDEQGNLQVDVMESSTETSLESLILRYPNSFVHLVRVNAQPDISLTALFSGR